MRLKTSATPKFSRAEIAKISALGTFSCQRVIDSFKEASSPLSILFISSKTGILLFVILLKKASSFNSFSPSSTIYNKTSASSKADFTKSIMLSWSWYAGLMIPGVSLSNIWKSSPLTIPKIL